MGERRKKKKEIAKECQQNKKKEREKEGGGEEDRMKSKKKEKRVEMKYCVGTEPSVLVYICILVTSTTTGHDGSVVSALASQAKGRGSIPSCGTSFYSHKYFLSSLRGVSN